MQIDRTAVSRRTPDRAFCVFACDGCAGICLPLYMMLNRDEQDALCRQFRQGATPATWH